VRNNTYPGTASHLKSTTFAHQFTIRPFMQIKATAVSNLTDARYFAAQNVAFLGFILEENHPDYLQPAQMKAMREWVEGPAIVGEFFDSSFDLVREALDFFQLDAVEVPADPGRSNWHVLDGLQVLARCTANTPEAVENLARQLPIKIAFFVVDCTAADLLAAPEAWAALCAEFPVLLHTDADAQQLLLLRDQVQPAGFSVRGGDEEQVGVKSFDEIDALFEVLEQE
jgi:phosphoribosylanthranilate isomerase